MEFYTRKGGGTQGVRISRFWHYDKKWCGWEVLPEVHCNLCNHCYTLGMPGPRPDIRCVQYLPKSTSEAPHVRPRPFSLVRSKPHQDFSVLPNQDFWILIKIMSLPRFGTWADHEFIKATESWSRSWLSSPIRSRLLNLARSRSSKIKQSTSLLKH